MRRQIEVNNQWLIYSRSGIESNLRGALRLTMLLHLQLRQEALAKQRSSAVRTALMNA